VTDGPSELEAYLAARDVPCPGCGFNLRGLAGESCPECGDGITLAALGAPARSLSEHLADRDEPCPACRYNLRGLTEDRCPECGAKVTLSLLGFVVVLADADRFIVRWCAAVAAVAFGLIAIVWLVRAGFAGLAPLAPGLAFAGVALKAESVQRWMVESETRRSLALAFVFGGAGIAIAMLTAAV